MGRKGKGGTASSVMNQHYVLAFFTVVCLVIRPLKESEVALT